MAYRDHAGRLTSALHRHGIARRINSTYDGQWRRCQVETAMPWRWLARIANRPETPHLQEVQRRGQRCWRWTFLRPPSRDLVNHGR